METVQLVPEHAQQQIVGIKLEAFRDFANNVCNVMVTHVVEQLCNEFERELSGMYLQSCKYRGELERCAETLGQQLNREHQLQESVLNMEEIHRSMVDQAKDLNQQQPNIQEVMQSLQSIHGMVQQIHGKHSEIRNSTISGLSEASAAIEPHVKQAEQFQAPMISAETEFNRILQILEKPPVETKQQSQIGRALTNDQKHTPCQSQSPQRPSLPQDIGERKVSIDEKAKQMMASITAQAKAAATWKTVQDGSPGGGV